MMDIKITTVIQVVGMVLTAVGTSSIFIENASVYLDGLQIVLAIGLALTAITVITEKTSFKNRKMKNRILSFLLLLISSNLMAQDYSKQIDAFAKSFDTKNIEILLPHMSSELQFGQIPKSNTPAIMKNIVTNLPKLNEISILETEHRKVKVMYDFEVIGKSSSFIHFDADGKITRVQLVEDLINQQMEAQRQQKVPLPTPRALGEKYTSQEIQFKAPDGLMISGDLYEIDHEKPVILLLHQAGYNRIEYVDIAPKLNEMGYSCLAVDLRSGGSFGDKPNLTNEQAIQKGLQPEMLDAQQDIKAAIDFLHEKYNQDVIVWGSSFSSSLALMEGEVNSKIRAVISFSPGDYFGDNVKSLSKVFSKIGIPFLVTSSKAESEKLSTLIGDINLKKYQIQFIPESHGFHGSRALWEGQEGAQEYWNAITTFLSKLK